MAKGAKKVSDDRQGDFFAHAELFPVRRPLETARPVDLSLRIKTAMGRALKECPDSATIVAARIAEMTGREITADGLYAYTAASKPDHDMGILRFVAFVRATQAPWLWDELVRDDGLMVLQEREALFAQAGLLRQEQARISSKLKEIERDLAADPVVVTTRRGGSR
jgi:hypothetical protein